MCCSVNGPKLYTFFLQIWDFNLGQLRAHDESDPLEYTASDVGYVMRSYGELLKEASLGTTKGAEISGFNCSIVHEDMVGFNVSDSTCFNLLSLG